MLIESVINNDYNTFIKLVNNDNIHGEIFLLAVKLNRENMYKQFLNIVDLDYEDDKGNTFIKLLNKPKDYIKNIIKKYKITNIPYDIFPELPPFIIIKFQIKNILLNDDINEFKKYYKNNYDKKNLLILSTEYNAEKISTYLIKYNIGLTFISEKKTTPFTYICYHNNAYLAQQYLSKVTSKYFLTNRDIFNKQPLQYISNNNMSNIIDLIFKMKDDSIKFISNFRIFKIDEFKLNNNTLNTNNIIIGGQGKIYNVEHISGKRMILKEYNNYSNCINEITILKLLNKHIEKSVVNIYGILFIDNKIYIVEEFLYMTLDEYFKIINYTNKFSYNILLYKLLLLVDIINKIGIIHKDLNIYNIMIDFSNNFKLIDFGISIYYGILPDINLINNIKNTYTTPPNIIKYNNKILKNNIIVSFNIDSFAIAIIILNYLFKSGKAKFISINNLLYYSLSEEYILLEEQNQFDYKFLDLLNKMLNYNKNFCAIDALNHEFFIGETEKIEKISYLSYHTIKNLIDNDLTNVYDNYIANNARLINFPNFNQKININVIAKSLKLMINNQSFNPDLFINLIIKINKVPIINDKIFKIIEFINNSQYNKNEEIINDKYLKYYLIKYEDFKFYPIMTNIGYIISFLKRHNLDSNLIKKTYVDLTIIVILWCIHCMSNENQIILTIWELVQCGYSILCKTNDLLPKIWGNDCTENLNEINECFNNSKYYNFFEKRLYQYYNI